MAMFGTDRPCSRRPQSLSSEGTPNASRTGCGTVAALVDVQERSGHSTRGLAATSPEEMQWFARTSGYRPFSALSSTRCCPKSNDRSMLRCDPPFDASVDGHDLRSKPCGAIHRDPPIPVGCLRIACRLRGCDGSAPRTLRAAWRGGDWSPQRDEFRVRAPDDRRQDESNVQVAQLPQIASCGVAGAVAHHAIVRKRRRASRLPSRARRLRRP